MTSRSRFRYPCLGHHNTDRTRERRFHVTIHTDSRVGVRWCECVRGSSKFERALVAAKEPLRSTVWSGLVLPAVHTFTPPRRAERCVLLSVNEEKRVRGKSRRISERRPKTTTERQFSGSLVIEFGFVCLKSLKSQKTVEGWCKSSLEIELIRKWN